MEQNSAGKKMEILIQGNWVDVSSFVSRHPGGRIIRFQVGADGTQAFQEFHERSEKAKRVLAGLPSRPSTSFVPPLLEDFENLREELEREGFFQPSFVHVSYRILELILIHSLGIYFLKAGDSGFQIILGLLILGIAQGRCAWLMHEGGHYSLTGNIVLDRTLQEFVYGIGCGMSASWWRSQHNRHHAAPQKLQHDVDMETLPLVAFNHLMLNKVHENQILLKIWIKAQAFLFGPITSFLLAIGWQFYLHPQHIAHKQIFNEAIALAIRYFLIFGIILSSYSFSHAMLLFFFYDWIGAMYIFVNFSISHSHKPVLKPHEHVTWVHYAASHTTNVTPNPFTDWWTGYLSYQIEHHLFPCMPQFRLQGTTSRVKRLFARHGLKYDVRSYWECVLATFQNLNEVAQHEEK